MGQWVRDGGPPIAVRTSGSTGRPKDVVLSHEAVLASARASLDRLGGLGQWLLALPATGVGGLQVVVRSVLAGEPVVHVGHGDLAAGIASMSAARRYASLVPTQLHRLAVAGELDLLASLDAVLVGGAAIDPDLLGRARAAGVNVVRTYGMSETSGGCVYDGRPLDDVRLRIDGAGPDGVGRVEVAGPVLFDGYGLSEGAASAAQPRRTEWFDTDDLGRIDDGVLTIVGRADDVVLSGGMKVPLPAVEQTLRSLPEVQDVAVVGVPDPEWGTRVAALVVPADATCLDGVRTEQLRDALEDAGLDRRWAPRETRLADAVPLLPGGKVDRDAVRRALA